VTAESEFESEFVAEFVAVGGAEVVVIGESVAVLRSASERARRAMVAR
jgi:hypothetical protein